MDRTIAEEELARRLPEALDRVRLHGERLTIDRVGEPIAILSPVQVPGAVTWRQVAELLAETGFPGDGFADDVEAAKAAQPWLDAPAWLS